VTTTIGGPASAPPSPTKTGKATTIILQALPIPDRDGQCKIVLRPPKDEQHDDDRRGHDRSDRDSRDNKSGSRRR
jgi:hypothetical protein